MELTSCSSRLMRESNCCLASVLAPEIRFLDCGENTHVVLRAMQLLHGTLRSHFNLQTC